MRWLGRRTTLDMGRTLGLLLADAMRACQMPERLCGKGIRRGASPLIRKHTRKRQETDSYYLPLFESQKKQFEAEIQKLESDHAAQSEKLRRQRGSEVRSEYENHRDLRAKTEGRLNDELKAAEDAFQQKIAAATATRDEKWERMAEAWRDTTQSACRTFGTLRNEGATLFPPWGELERDGRPLASRVPAGIRFGDMSVDLKALPEGVPSDQRLAPPSNLPGWCRPFCRSPSVAQFCCVPATKDERPRLQHFRP